MSRPDRKGLLFSTETLRMKRDRSFDLSLFILDDQKDAKQYYHLTSPRAWRSGLEPAELSFRVPHFFHQTRKGPVQ